jgi:hypothetical protein
VWVQGLAEKTLIQIKESMQNSETSVPFTWVQVWEPKRQNWTLGLWLTWGSKLSFVHQSGHLWCQVTSHTNHKGQWTVFQRNTCSALFNSWYRGHSLSQIFLSEVLYHLNHTPSQVLEFELRASHLWGRCFKLQPYLQSPKLTTS